MCQRSLSLAVMNSVMIQFYCSRELFRPFMLVILIAVDLLLSSLVEK